MGPASASVIVLAGGAGTRIRHLHPGVPKPLIPVAGHPFLHWICRYWAAQGVARIIVSAGYRADAVERYLAGNAWPGMQIDAVTEEQPLGTGGGARAAAASHLAGDPLVIVNGDSLVFADISGVWPLLERERTDGVLLGVEMPDAGRFGSLDIDAEGRLLGFREKRPGRGVVNAGVYFFKKRLLSQFPDRVPLSMEFDVFPALIAAGARFQVHLTAGEFLDIGTPESLAAAGAFIVRHMAELAGAKA